MDKKTVIQDAEHEAWLDYFLVFDVYDNLLDAKEELNRAIHTTEKKYVVLLLDLYTLHGELTLDEYTALFFRLLKLMAGYYNPSEKQVAEVIDKAISARVLPTTVSVHRQAVAEALVKQLPNKKKWWWTTGNAWRFFTDKDKKDKKDGQKKVKK